ncbi:hypothetical protein BpHYR1_028090 [Brachionus plicatilis]|uniref:Uncharacterized protein n=1 Tax=Brachionus plicatilis TaxID=10195 RepID=A0A3M7Q6S2_BRAPC|nr:hypothetical protein BpHYR1_028090 [Brachionus plicatilis]
MSKKSPTSITKKFSWSIKSTISIECANSTTTKTTAVQATFNRYLQFYLKEILNKQFFPDLLGSGGSRFSSNRTCLLSLITMSRLSKSRLKNKCLIDKIISEYYWLLQQLPEYTSVALLKAFG